ncbi:alpha-2-macroglobulin family protein [Mesorhizobium sp. CAU 1741]|uniref:alpha-2-macroglobulin family protein n=1 Tax=Mesorhizobium sp. CAU 1741 TaxID=3140366 RepID=UPI00325C3056
MSLRAARYFSVIFFVLAGIAAASAQDGLRSIETSPDGDYFGFDLRTERDVTLDQCTAVCLADTQCRAFTYNTRAQWCFLKSDFSVLKPFTGAVAGRVVDISGEPDLGAPPPLAYVPDHVKEDARRYRTTILQAQPNEEIGIVYLSSSAGSALEAGDPRAATASYAAALAIDPDDRELWVSLARATLSIEPQNSTEQTEFARNGTSAALNAYDLSRTVNARARSLAEIAAGLDRRELYRPALRAYEASLLLVNDAGVRERYADLKSRRGFRVVDNSVDADVVAPRACIQFSEDLVKSGVDYSSFVTLDDAQPQAIEVSARQICVEGLEHGAHYRIGVRQGLPSAIGEVLENPVALSIYVRDRAPSLRFSGENFVLPAAGRHAIPMVSVNAPSAELKLHRVGDRSLAGLLTGSQFLRQLDTYGIGEIAESSGELVWEGTIELDDALNEDVTTSFPVAEALPEREPGVYVLTATPKGDLSESWAAKATQWFVVSDIGLSTYAGEDGLTVFARSLASAKPLSGVELQLLARNNEVLGNATTDEKGRAVFTPGLIRGTSGLAPAVLTAAKSGGDFVFLDMTRAGFDLSDRGVTGRAAPGALDIFAWTERGIYRAGETVHASALVRDDSAEAIEALPLTFIFTRPDGVEERRIVSDGRAMGGHHVPLELQQTAMLGSWNLRIHTDPDQAPVAQSVFLVEEFVPDRIEFDLTVETPEVEPGDVARLSVDGRYLYGAPAAGLALEGEAAIGARREWDRFPGFSFGLADEEIDTVSVPLALEPANEDGHSEFEAPLDTLPYTTALLDAQVVVRMREPGGRAVERRGSVTIRPQEPVIGIRPEFAGTEVPENSTAAFRLIAVEPDGTRIALGDANWTLTKIERNYQWYRSDNSWNYEAIETERRVDGGAFDIGADEPALLRTPVEWGRYRVDVESGDATGPVASFEFDAGWFVEAASTETPDGLEIALDKEQYEAGETARLRVSPRFAGELMVAIGSERLLDTIEATVPEGGAEIEIPVSDDWGAGAYVTAVLYRSGSSEEGRMPARAIGVKWLSIDPAERKLEVSLDTPEQAAPREDLSIPVTLAGLAPGEEAYVSVAAVDVGILTLTSYEAPDPEGWYFGQRRLGLEMRDIYGRLIDGSAGAFGRLRTGGDGGGLTAQGSPPTEKLLAYFSGPVRVDGEGNAEIVVPVPEFNGTARIMAVAWSKSGVGQASSDVVIRDPVVVTAGQPRFMATGDQAEIRLDIHNTDGPAGDYALSIVPDGTATFDFGNAPQAVSLGEDERTTVVLPVSALSTGDATITVALAHPDGLIVERTLYLPVRQPAMPTASRQVVSVPPGGSLRIDEQLLASSLLDGASVSVGISPVSAFDLPSLLMTLDRYPYGCTEQTISRALPLLYVSELSSATGMEDDPGLRDRVQDAIGRVMNAQSSSGTFGLWGPGYGDMWLDAYVGEFLTRAREGGYSVPAQGMTSTLDNLQNQLSYTTDVAERGTEIAYALYVLARNRRASVGDLRYYADARIEEFSSPMARAQLAAALSLYGDSQRAERAFASAFRQAQAGSDTGFYRSDYGSSLRDGAAMLALAAETRPEPGAIPAMMRFVADERAGKSHTSTQEEVWMVLAARALSEASDAITLEVDGATHEGSFARRMSGEELETAPLLVANRGTDPVDAVITTVAASSQPLPAGGEGFTIDRTYFTLDGEEANITGAAQNERFVVVLRVEELNDWQSRVAVTDLLPAGFEIDNPRLVGSAELANFEWLGEAAAVHSEFRDDRFVAAFDRDGGGSFFVAYVVRAATPGIYSHPAAVVEDMYRPQFNARTAAGMMEVVAAR